MIPGMMYGAHAGAMVDMTACMGQMSVYQQQQQFGLYINVRARACVYWSIPCRNIMPVSEFVIWAGVL